MIRGLWRSKEAKEAQKEAKEAQKEGHSPSAAFHPVSESPKFGTPKIDNLGKKISRAFSGRSKK